MVNEAQAHILHPLPDGGIALDTPVIQFLRSMGVHTARWQPVVAAVFMLTEDGRVVAEMMTVQGLPSPLLLGMLDAGHERLRRKILPWADTAEAADVPKPEPETEPVPWSSLSGNDFYE
jgi:hypothetical protein